MGTNLEPESGVPLVLTRRLKVGRLTKETWDLLGDTQGESVQGVRSQEASANVLITGF